MRRISPTRLDVRPEPSRAARAAGRRSDPLLGAPNGDEAVLRAGRVEREAAWGRRDEERPLRTDDRSDMLLRESKEANLRFKVDAVFDAYGVLNVKHKRNDVGSMRMPQVHDEIGMKI